MNTFITKITMLTILVFLIPFYSFANSPDGPSGNSKNKLYLFQVCQASDAVQHFSALAATSNDDYTKKMYENRAKEYAKFFYLKNDVVSRVVSYYQHNKDIAIYGGLRVDLQACLAQPDKYIPNYNYLVSSGKIE